MRRKRYFEWIAGEDIGNVVSLVSIEEFDGEIFYNFDDGESCNQRFISKMTGSVADLKEKFMVEIENPSNPWTFDTIQSRKYVDESMKGQDIDIPTLHDIIQARGTESNVENSDLGKERLVPPKRQQRIVDLPTIDEYPVKKVETSQQKNINNSSENIEKDKNVDNVVDELANKQSEQRSFTPVQQTVGSMDPVRILVSTCKKHDTPVEMTINMKLPSKYIYGIAVNEFEDGLEKFIDCIVDGIDTKMIIDQLKEALRAAYVSEESEEN
jgi:hypothetical protein